MQKTRRIIPFALILAMLTALFSLQGFAVEQTATFTVTPSAETVEVGDMVTVTVSATTNYYAATTQIPVYYDDTLFEFVPDSITATGIFGEGKATRVYQDSKSGVVNVAFVPDSYADASARILEDTVLFTFRLKAKARGVSEVGLHAEDQKTKSNKGGALYCGAFATADVSSEVSPVGQTFVRNNTQITVKAGKPTLFPAKPARQIKMSVEGEAVVKGTEQLRVISSISKDDWDLYFKNTTNENATTDKLVAVGIVAHKGLEFDMETAMETAKLPNGTEEYSVQTTGYIQQTETDYRFAACIKYVSDVFDTTYIAFVQYKDADGNDAFAFYNTSYELALKRDYVTITEQYIQFISNR